MCCLAGGCPSTAAVHPSVLLLLLLLLLLFLSFLLLSSAGGHQQSVFEEVAPSVSVSHAWVGGEGR